MYIYIYSFGACIYEEHFFGVARNQTSNQITRVNQKKLKSSQNKYSNMKTNCHIVISRQNFSCYLNSSRTWLLQNMSDLPLRLYK